MVIIPENGDDESSEKSWYEQLTKNFDYSYTRRNLRITFIIALLITYFFNLPIQNIYQKQNSLSTDQLANLTEKVISIKNSLPSFAGDDGVITDSTINFDYGKLITRINDVISNDTIKVQFAEFKIPWEFESFGYFFTYTLGCIVTSILICFGAPFWNDILGAITSMKNRNSKTENQPNKE